MREKLDPVTMPMSSDSSVDFLGRLGGCATDTLQSLASWMYFIVFSVSFLSRS